ncbi:MAG TPA: alpha/beta hydrolase, partial [Acidimicrobiales bacterium]|nr:alpha/beta hydrolase [Acidimicrobiales bacterium]
RGASGRYWDRLAEVAGGFAGVAPDLLGFGRSPKPAASSYSVDEHLDALAPLLEAPTVVVGHSTGAILAGALAARERERVAALLLMGLPAFGDEATARAEIGRLGLLARLTVEGSDIARLVCQAMCLLRPLAVTLGPLVIRDLPPAVVADGARHTWPSYSRTLDRVVVGHRPLPDLVDAGVPTVVAHGRRDLVAPVALAEALVAAARQRGAPVELRLLEGDHHLAVRRPEALAAVLRQLRSPSGTGDGEGGPSRR